MTKTLSLFFHCPKLLYLNAISLKLREHDQAKVYVSNATFPIIPKRKNLISHSDLKKKMCDVYIFLLMKSELSWLFLLLLLFHFIKIEAKKQMIFKNNFYFRKAFPLFVMAELNSFFFILMKNRIIFINLRDKKLSKKLRYVFILLT